MGIGTDNTVTWTMKRGVRWYNTITNYNDGGAKQILGWYGGGGGGRCEGGVRDAIEVRYVVHSSPPCTHSNDLVCPKKEKIQHNKASNCLSGVRDHVCLSQNTIRLLKESTGSYLWMTSQTFAITTSSPSQNFT